VTLDINISQELEYLRSLIDSTDLSKTLEGFKKQHPQVSGVMKSLSDVILSAFNEIRNPAQERLELLQVSSRLDINSLVESMGKG